MFVRGLLGESSHEVIEEWAEYKFTKKCKSLYFLELEVMPSMGIHFPSLTSILSEIPSIHVCRMRKKLQVEKNLEFICKKSLEFTCLRNP